VANILRACRNGDGQQSRPGPVKYVTAREAAAILGTSVRTVRLLPIAAEHFGAQGKRHAAGGEQFGVQYIGRNR